MPSLRGAGLYAAAFVLACVLAGAGITKAYFKHDMSIGMSFVAMIPTETSAPPTATATASSTPTPLPSPTPTPVTCSNGEARLAINPTTVERHGIGPLAGALDVSNRARKATAIYVSLGLSIGDGASYVDRLVFANGQTWAIGAEPGSTLYFVGDVAPGASVRLAFTAYMTPAWATAAGAVVRIEVRIASATCARTSDAMATIELRRNADDSGIGDAPAPPAVEPAGTETPAAPAPTETQPTATAEPSPDAGPVLPPTMTPEAIPAIPGA